MLALKSILVGGLILTGAVAPAISQQTQYHCSVCGEVITSQAAVIDGKFYHPDCFRCALCGEPIRGDYVRDKAGRYYHRGCAQRTREEVCAYCLRPIADRNYVSYYGKFYHNSCYQNSVAPRCDICGEALGDSVITDFWGTRFHPRHAREFPICVACGRLIQRDGAEIEPGRRLCPICAARATLTPERARELLEQVREQLAASGIVVKTLGLRIELVTSDELNDGHWGGGTAHTYAGILWNSGRDERGDETALVKALVGLPDDLMRGVLAHELMHIWQHENGVDEAPLEIREGSANWASSLIYGQLRNDRGRYYIGGLEKSTDPLYGVGYRNVVKYADSHGVGGTLLMLRQEGAAASAAKKWESGKVRKERL